MVSLINLGNLTTTNGKTTLSGSASGIDTQSLVESLATAKRLPAVQLETSITNNNNKISALSALKANLQKLQDSLNVLRNPGGVTSASQNAFSARVPYLTMSGGKTAADYIGVTTANGAPIGKYDLKVIDLAGGEFRQTTTFADRTSSIVEATGGDTAGMFSAGTFQINGINVKFNEGDNLNNIAAAINSISSQSNVTASIVKFAEGDYRLALSHKNTGVDATITITDNDGVLPTTSIFDAAQTKAAKPAELEFNGQTVYRNTNKISDLVDNVTLSLFQKTQGETITLDIDKDGNQVATSVGNFIDAYNAIRVFAAEQQEKNQDGTLKETAVLNGNSTMNTALQRITSYISNQVSTSIPAYLNSGSSKPLRLGDLGISFTDFAGDSSDPENPIPATSNILSADAATLSSKLESYFDDVRNLFEFNFASSSANLGVFSRDNNVTKANFTIAVDETQIDAQKARITHIDGYELATPVYLQYTIVGGKKVISGADGSGFESISFTYKGGVNDTLVRESTMQNKDATISVNTANPIGQKAQLTHLFGQQLLSPVNMIFEEGTGSSTIKGAVGTSFENLVMVYSGDGTDSINISMTQGVADKMYNSLDEILSDLNGQTNMIDAEIESLQKNNDTLTTSIERIDTQIAEYRERMLEKFSALEAAISAANNILMLLDAQASARDNS